VLHARPSYLPRLDHSTYTRRRLQITKLLIIQFSPPYRYFIPLQTKYSLEHLISNTLSLCSSLFVTDQVLHPYRTTCKLQPCIF
jgi:hypothetical protein